MILFGWGHTMTRVFGPTFNYLCNHCHNEEYWILSRITTWFTLFFIPVFPYTVKYFLACPICQYGVELNSEQIEKIRPLAEINQLLLEGEITQEEYQTKVASLNGEKFPQKSTVAVEEVQALPTSTNDLKYCSECGKEVVREIKFCGNCGAHVAAV
jgi:hypothetical protein